MRAIIQPRARTLRIETEADKVKAKYNPKSVQDLERIAKEEYGVIEVVKTPLILISTVINAKDGVYIFYNASFGPYEPLTLGHEIGHIAAGHFNGGHQPGFFTREVEADYFSQLVNSVSSARFYAWSTIDIVLMAKALVAKTFVKKREVERLQDLGVYHALQ